MEILLSEAWNRKASWVVGCRIARSIPWFPDGHFLSSLKWVHGNALWICKYDFPKLSGFVRALDLAKGNGRGWILGSRNEDFDDGDLHVRGRLPIFIPQ